MGGPIPIFMPLAQFYQKLIKANSFYRPCTFNKHKTDYAK